MLRRKIRLYSRIPTLESFSSPETALQLHRTSYKKYIRLAISYLLAGSGCRDAKSSLPFHPTYSLLCFMLYADGLNALNALVCIFT